ncbi:MAG: response regulator [Betaproteobacteria bacterium]|nr:MAG: response regulator [Betaproteobacteria bacterium]
MAALDGLTKLQAGDTGNVATSVRSNLHKAAGAFELVGVEGFAVLLREFENHLPDPPGVAKPEALQTIAAACRRLVSHLEEIAAGAQAVPLRFLPEYLALGRLRAARFGPADLFFPDVSRKPRFTEASEAMDPSKMASYLLRHRRDFQRGFLDWLRGTQAQSGLALMQQALAGIEQVHPLPAQRSFWWVTSALLDAVQLNLIDSSTSVKQLFARIDLQIRRLVEGSTKVADRLKREVLYHVARVGDGSQRCDEVKALYSLDVLVPKRVPRELDVVALRPAIDSLNEIVARCKEEWSAVSTSRAGAAERLAAALAELPSASDAIGVRSLSELATALAGVAPVISSRALSDEGSLEFASSLLLLETATQHLAALPRTFASEVSVAVKRLGYATARAPIPAELLDQAGSGSLTRLAQERETVAQVCREIRANMRQIEAALDAFFRDATAIEDLVQIPGLLAQVGGALRLLGWNDAHRIVAQASERVTQLVAEPSAIETADIDRIANVLAGFGFYVDARERKESGAEAILESLERTLRGESALAPAEATDNSVELALDSRIRSLKSDFAQLKSDPSDSRARASVVAGLNDIRRDAELIDDGALARAAKSGLDAVSDSSLNFDQLQSELTPVIGVVAAPLAVSAETQRLLETPESFQDDALLEIFAEEATEVVDNIESGMREYVQAPARTDLLKDIRRGFHTLKGSGRMVGLTALGDAAWSVERVLNPVLEEGRVLSANEIELVNESTRQFKGWVVELNATKRVHVPAHPFDALVQKCGFAAAQPMPAPAPMTAQSTTPPPVPVATPAESAEASSGSVSALLGLGVLAATQAESAAALAPALADSTTHAPPPLAGGKAHEDFELDLSGFADAAPIESREAPTVSSFDEIVLEPLSAHASSPVTPVESVVVASEPTNAAVPVEASLPVAEVVIQPAAPPWSDEVVVDGVRVSRTLFSIMGDEARSHLTTLDQELSLMQFDPHLLPSDAMIRAAHTLCGIHRTAGFNAIGTLAGLLEEALVAVRRTKQVESNLATLANGVETLRGAVLRLQSQAPVGPSESAMVAASTVELRNFLQALGGTHGGAAAELARTTFIEEEPSFEIEEEILLELPEDFGTQSLSVESPPAPTPIGFNERSQNSPTATPARDVTGPSSLPSFAAAFGVAGTVGAAGVLGAVAATGTSAVDSAAKPPAYLAGLDPSSATADALSAGAGISAPTAAPVVLPSTSVGSLGAIAANENIASNVVSIGASAAKVSASDSISDRLAAALSEAPKPSAMPPAGEDPLLGVNDDIDVQVLPIFLEEAQELFPNASAEIRNLRSNPGDRANLDSLKRTLHTLKGSARMAGAMRLGELTHIVESAVAENSGAFNDADLHQIEERFDDVAFVLDALVAGRYNVVLPRYASVIAADDADNAPSSFDDAAESAAAFIAEQVETGALPSDADIAATLPLAVQAAVRDGATVTGAPVPQVAAGVAAAVTMTAAPVQESAVAFLRVRTDAVELLADEAGEIAINRSRIESEMRGLKGSLNDLTSFVVRLRTLLREIEIQGESQIQSRLDQESTFDPLEFDRYTRFQELTRGLAEGVNDVATVQQNLIKSIDDADTALAAQTRLSRSVQLRLQSLRTVPFSTVTERLYRVLRQTAKDVGKRANLDIVGGRIEIDRGVLERLIPVLEHLVRNSFAHGIEAPDARESAGKPAIGEINIAVKQQGNEVAIEFTDDGSGIALERVRQRAISAGLAQADERLNDAQLIEFIFRPGFTTADAVTAIAGRGVGMDVVRSELAALGGRVVASTVAGVGTKFVLSVPLTLAVTQVLLVDIAGVTYGVPSSLIETVRQIPARDRTVALAAKQIEIAGKWIPYRSMSVLLGGRPNGSVNKTYSVAFVRAGEATVAVEIDRVIGNQEVVAKPYGPQLARVPGMAGLTVLGDGKIVLLMDPLALLRAAAEGTATAAITRATAAPSTATTPPAIVAAGPAPVSPATVPPAPTPAATAATAAAGDSEPVVELVEAREVAPPQAIEVAPVSSLEPPPVPEPISPEPEPEPEVIGRLPIVLVVDDSLTVRKITSRLLEREGFHSMTAKDGLDALQVLSTVNPDVILLDIEMPRMDGFEFTKTIKADNRQNNIPIIMITSRTAEKHRSHAKELGVNEYLGKPYQDEQLIGLVRQYTAHVVRPS